MASAPLGAGFAPVGSSLAGFGVPGSADGPTGVVFKNTDDQRTTATQLTGRKIDKFTRQYTFGSDGRIVGQSTLQQLVQIAWQTVKGSSADPTIGQELGTIDVIGSDHTTRVANLLTAPVQAFIDQGLMKILSIDVSRVGVSGTIANVRWVDLTTGQEHLSPV